MVLRPVDGRLFVYDGVRPRCVVDGLFVTELRRGVVVVDGVVSLFVVVLRSIDVRPRPSIRYILSRDGVVVVEGCTVCDGRM